MQCLVHIIKHFKCFRRSFYATEEVKNDLFFIKDVRCNLYAWNFVGIMINSMYSQAEFTDMALKLKLLYCFQNQANSFHLVFRMRMK